MNYFSFLSASIAPCSIDILYGDRYAKLKCLGLRMLIYRINSGRLPRLEHWKKKNLKKKNNKKPHKVDFCEICRYRKQLLPISILHPFHLLFLANLSPEYLLTHSGYQRNQLEMSENESLWKWVCVCIFIKTEFFSSQGVGQLLLLLHSLPINPPENEAGTIN